MVETPLGGRVGGVRSMIEVSAWLRHDRPHVSPVTHKFDRAQYHVTARGDSMEPIYDDDDDRDCLRE